MGTLIARQGSRTPKLFCRSDHPMFRPTLVELCERRLEMQRAELERGESSTTQADRYWTESR
jgi:hypothetical protein